jgi:hypothetical protein
MPRARRRPTKQRLAGRGTTLVVGRSPLRHGLPYTRNEWREQLLVGSAPKRLVCREPPLLRDQRRIWRSRKVGVQTQCASPPRMCSWRDCIHDREVGTSPRTCASTATLKVTESRPRIGGRGDRPRGEQTRKGRSPLSDRPAEHGRARGSNHPRRHEHPELPGAREQPDGQSVLELVGRPVPAHRRTSA